MGHVLITGWERVNQQIRVQIRHMLSSRFGEDSPAKQGVGWAHMFICKVKCRFGTCSTANQGAGLGTCSLANQHSPEGGGAPPWALIVQATA
eukprot:scaffold46621_cov23-Tisochrysis_lutea.AAC.1